MLIEHTAGAFPVWISPVQVQVLPVSKKHESAAKKILKELLASDIRAELTESSETLGKRIREGEIQKIPYLLIVGDKEIKAKTVAVRGRDKGNLGTEKLSSFIESIKKEIAKKR